MLIMLLTVRDHVRPEARALKLPIDIEFKAQTGRINHNQLMYHGTETKCFLILVTVPLWDFGTIMEVHITVALNDRRETSRILSLPTISDN